MIVYFYDDIKFVWETSFSLSSNNDLGVVQSPIGGDFITELCRKMIDKDNIEIVPYYKIASKVICLILQNYYYSSTIITTKLERS